MSIGVAPSASTMSNTVHVSMTSALPSSYRAMSSSVYGSQSFLRHPRLFPQSAQFRRNQLLVAPSRRSQRNDVIGFFTLFRHFFPSLRHTDCRTSTGAFGPARIPSRVTFPLAGGGWLTPSGSWRISRGNRSLRRFLSLFSCQETSEAATAQTLPSLNQKRTGKVRLFPEKNLPKIQKSAFCTK